MTWRLYDGREMNAEGPEDLFLGNSERESGCFGTPFVAGPEGFELAYRGQPLTEAERREVAVAVISCWERWAGLPISRP